MKRFKALLSVVLVLSIFSLCFVQAFAAENTAVSPEEKISSELAEKMAEADEDELIPVWIWYQDIDQDEVDRETEKEIGFSENNLLTQSKSFINGSDYTKSNFDSYLKSTAVLRNNEKEMTESYIKTRRKISSETYIEKSQTIIEEISIDTEKIMFCSHYSPMIIVNLTKMEILSLSHSLWVECVGFYSEAEPEEQTISQAIENTNVFRMNDGTQLGLTGNSVKVGLLEGSRITFSSEKEGELELDNPTGVLRYASNGVSLMDYGNVVVVDGLQPGDYSGTNVPHADVVSKTLLSVAPNIILYCCNLNAQNIEALLDDGVQILNISCVYSVPENYPDYQYYVWDKWFDHIISQHSVTIATAAGNDGNYDVDTQITDPTTGQTIWKRPRVKTPGMAQNTIAVGMYKEQSDASNDYLDSMSSHKNCIVGHYGCEKPDVVMPSGFNGGGTSNAAPFLTGILAMILELKPSLGAFPQAIKAIVLASCHRKVQQSVALNGPEEMENGIPDRSKTGSNSGITERQGAGAPDAWTMVCIVCQGTYGISLIEDSTKYINIEQPNYDAQKMNISLTWIKENSSANETQSSHNYYYTIVEGQSSDLDLIVENEDEEVKKSALNYSSTEMCYIDTSDTDSRYRIKIVQNSTPTPVRFGYAWSTNSMRITPPNDSVFISDGIWNIQNKGDKRYLKYNPNTSYDSQKAKALISANSSQSDFTNDLKWIVRESGSGYKTIETGYGTERKYLGIGNSGYNTILYPQMTTESSSFIFELNPEDGSFCVFNTDRDRIMSIDNSRSIVWKPFNSQSTITNYEKWYFERVNYLPGDANSDGTISDQDAYYVQKIRAHIVIPTNIETYLSDADRDGVVSILDSIKIYNMINSIYSY